MRVQDTPYNYGQLSLDKDAKTTQWVKKSFSIHGGRKTRYSHAKNECGPLPISYAKINSK